MWGRRGGEEEMVAISGGAEAVGRGGIRMITVSMKCIAAGMICIDINII